jgi:hypothetical protein
MNPPNSDCSMTGWVMTYSSDDPHGACPRALSPCNNVENASCQPPVTPVEPTRESLKKGGSAYLLDARHGGGLRPELC